MPQKISNLDLELEELRKLIDEQDRIIVNAFERRMDISQKIAKLKNEKLLPIFDPIREDKVINSRLAMVSDQKIKILLVVYFTL